MKRSAVTSLFLKQALPLLLALCLCCACSAPTPEKATPVVTAPVLTPAPALEQTPPAAPTPTAPMAYPAAPAEPTPAEADPAEILPEEPRCCYDVAMQLLPQQRLLVCAMRLDYVNTSEDTLQEIYLHLYPNAYATKEQLSKEELSRNYPNGFSPAELVVEEAACGEEKASFTLREQGELLLLSLSKPLLPGETAALYLRYTVTVPERLGILAKTELGYQLAYCIPTAAVYENGAWDTRTRPPLGDALYTRCADYRVAFTRPADYLVAASGTLVREETEQDGTVTGYYAVSRARDFCLCASSSYSVFTETSNNGATILSYAMTEASARSAARAARDMLNFMEQQLPSYPYDTLTVAQVQLHWTGGMEFPGLMMIDRANYLNNMGTQLMSIIAHETAHQWFYAMVGSDQLAQPWLDEALAQYLGVKALMQNTGIFSVPAFSELVSEDAGKPYPIDGSVFDYPNSDAYSDAVYRRGAWLFFSLEQELGSDVFWDGLNRYCQASAYRIADRDALISAFSKAAKRDLTDWFTAALAPLE